MDILAWLPQAPTEVFEAADWYAEQSAEDNSDQFTELWLNLKQVDSDYDLWPLDCAVNLAEQFANQLSELFADLFAEQSVDQFAEKFVKQFAELILKQIDSKSSLRSSWRFELWGAVHFAEMYSQLYVGQQSAENLVDIPVWNLRSMGHLAP